jgi:transcriptional regulator GlxA family with amidase domain
MAGHLELWKNLAGAAHYDARELAKLCALSTRQLQRLFKQEIQRSPQDWLNEQRIEAARHLLLSGDSVKWVAFELGFKQVSHFCRQFKVYNNVTPSQFLNRSRVVSLMDNQCRSGIMVEG